MEQVTNRGVTTARVRVPGVRSQTFAQCFTVPGEHHIGHFRRGPERRRDRRRARLDRGRPDLVREVAGCEQVGGDDDRAVGLVAQRRDGLGRRRAGGRGVRRDDGAPAPVAAASRPARSATRAFAAGSEEPAAASTTAVRARSAAESTPDARLAQAALQGGQQQRMRAEGGGAAHRGTTALAPAAAARAASWAGISDLLWYAAVSSSGTTTHERARPSSSEPSTAGSDGAQWSRNAARTSMPPPAPRLRPSRHQAEQRVNGRRRARVLRPVRDRDERRVGDERGR